MKIFILFVLLGLFFASCKKNDDAVIATATATAGPRSFTCTINGTTFTADSAWYNNFNAGATNIFAVKGSGASWQYVEINLTGQTATTYNIPANPFTYLTATTTYVASTGSLNITTYDIPNRKISGNFTGITAGAVTLTAGSFANLPYK